MNARWWLAGLLLAFCVVAKPETPHNPAFPKFRMQEIATDLKVGYAVLLVDINNDGKPDIVAVDTTRIVWYENPTWKCRVITQGTTKPDNVCIAAYDIDGDGQLDLVVGAGWKGINTKADGPLYWLKRGKTLEEPWTVHPIGDEPSVHRIRFADIDGDGKPELIVVPLLGHNSTQANNFMDVPIEIAAYRIPKDPAKERWPREVLDHRLHVAHNFWPVPAAHGQGMDLLIASYEGVNRLTPFGPGRGTLLKLGEGNQAFPMSNRGASEIKQGMLSSGSPYIATIEPWHGNQVVLYTKGEADKAWNRQVIDEQLKWGHGVWCADLDGSPGDELIIGVRDNLSNKPGERCGVRIYQLDPAGKLTARHIIDDGGMAAEDLAAADLDGDGRIDIVAAGRQTHNLRIYWNQQER